jgi:hypothetical protein
MKLKVTLITLIFAQCIKAQTITSGSITPVIGESFTLHPIDVSSWSPVLIDYWFDYSSVTVDPFNITHDIADPVTTPYISNFPGSTYCVVAFGSDYFYYNASASGIVQQGYYLMGTLMEYSDTRKIMQYPLTPGASFSDPYLGYYTDPSSNCYKRTGNISVEWLDNGTLITSQGSFNNIVQVKSFDQWDDIEIDCFSQTEIGFSDNTQNTIYEYYEIGRHYPMIRVDVVGPMGFEYLVGKQLLVNDVSAEENNINPFIIFYNQQKLQIQTNKDNQLLEGHLVDMSGKVHYNFVHSDQANYEVDLASLNHGMYLLELMDQNHKTRVFKILK